MQTRIMIVDDEEVTGRLLVYQLHGLGYSAVYVQDGLRALQQILIEQPDLILLDVMMPLVSGWDVCREIRACSSVPIIMLTGKDADDDVVVGLAVGADDYVTKPFNMAQLQARIEAVLRRAGQRSHWASSPSQAARRSSTPEPRTPLPRTSMPHFAPATAEAQTILAARIGPAPITQFVESAPAAHFYATERIPAPIPARGARPTLLGPHLYAARQARGLSLYQAAQLCQMRWDYLQAIEQEHWNYIPRPQLHKAIRQYAAFLNVDSGQAITTPHESMPIWYYVVIVAVTLVLVCFFVLLILARRGMIG